jgi:hypothetical protein
VTTTDTRDQAAAEDPFFEPEPEGTRRCAGRNKHGKPCGKDPEPGRDYCEHHGPDDAEPEERKSQATLLVELAQSRYTFGQTPTGEPFALPIDGPQVPRMLRAKRGSLRTELSKDFAVEHKKVPGSSALTDAMLALEGMANETDPVELHLRVARHRGGIVIDLGDASGRVVLVKPGAWTVLDDPPEGVLFRRTALTAPLPEPERGGTLEELRQVVNVTDETWTLLVGAIITAMTPGIPHTIVLFTGEQGSGKSTGCSQVVTLLDPSPAPLRSTPKDLDDWVVAAAGSWMVALDNLSNVPPWLSDAMCRASTGEGLVKRALWSDDDLAVLQFRRCVLLTTIDAGSLRGDLVDRLLPIELETIGKGQRREDHQLAELFEAMRPRALAGALDLLAEVLAALPTVKVDKLPRMADFARILAAIDQVRGWKSLELYLSLAESMATDLVDADPVAAAIRSLAIVMVPSWEGTAAELLRELPMHRPDATDRDGEPKPLPKGWPADPTRLSGRLKKAAGPLRQVGIDVDWFREPGGSSDGKRERRIRLSYTPKASA